MFNHFLQLVDSAVSAPSSTSRLFTTPSLTYRAAMDSSVLFIVHTPWKPTKPVRSGASLWTILSAGPVTSCHLGPSRVIAFSGFFEVKWARNARAAGEIPRGSSDQQESYNGGYVQSLDNALPQNGIFSEPSVSTADAAAVAVHPTRHDS